MATKSPGPPAHVLVTAGPGKGRTLDVKPSGKATVGRAPECDLRIPDAAVSRKQLELEHRPGGLLITDVGRAGVARLDGRAIPAGGLLVGLRGVLTLGGATLEVSRRAPSKRPLEGLELRELLGQGGSSSVHVAWQDPPGREVAVKTLLPGAETDDARRLVREAVLEGRLDHPSIARVHDLIDAHGELHLVRELVRGETLGKRVGRAPLPPAEVARLGHELAQALAHAHARGVVHRDVKPENVVLEEPGGRAKLLDFGFAKDARAELTRLTETGDAFGSISYVAPEQLHDAKDVGPPADVYGLGAVLYFALTAVAPFSDVPFEDYVRRLSGEGPTPLGELAPGAPAALVTAVRRAMSPDPSSRPEALAFARTLARVVKT